MTIPPHLNQSVTVTVEEQFVCPERKVFIDVFGKLRPNFVPVSHNRIGYSVQIGNKVALKKNRLRIVGDQLVKKPEGRRRFIIDIKQYNSAEAFDEAANRVVRGSKAPCTPFPAYRTAQFARIAEGTFSLDELTFKSLQ
jgi:hypothetical protein